MYKLEYSPALDGLRAVLAFAVFAFHFSSFGMHTFRGGFLAVDAFFVLSGFLITSILVEEFEARGRIAIGRFLTRRSARLFPAAWVVLLAVAVVQWLTSAETGIGEWGVWLWFYLVNIVMAIKDEWAGWFNHYWSLAIEEQFYVVWPFVLYALLRRGCKPHQIAVGSGLVFLVAHVAMALATAGVASGDSSFFPYFIGTWTRGSALLLGAAVALAIRHPSVWERMRARPGGELHLTPFFLLGLAFVSFRDHHVYTAWLYNRGGYLLVALVSMWAILDLVRAPNSVAARLLAVPPLVALGKRSYSIYLWHLPIIWYVRLVLDISYIEQPARMVGTSLALTMVAAELSYRLIEQPFRKLGRRLSEEPAHLRA